MVFGGHAMTDCGCGRTRPVLGGRTPLSLQEMILSAFPVALPQISELMSIIP